MSFPSTIDDLMACFCSGKEAIPPQNEIRRSKKRNGIPKATQSKGAVLFFLSLHIRKYIDVYPAVFDDAEQLQCKSEPIFLAIR